VRFESSTTARASRLERREARSLTDRKRAAKTAPTGQGGCGKLRHERGFRGTASWPPLHDSRSASCCVRNKAVLAPSDREAPRQGACRGGTPPDSPRFRELPPTRGRLETPLALRFDGVGVKSGEDSDSAHSRASICAGSGYQPIEVTDRPLSGTRVFTRDVTAVSAPGDQADRPRVS